MPLKLYSSNQFYLSQFTRICFNLHPIDSSTTPCPASHPFAYNNGKHCCESGFEKDHIFWKGDPILLTSKSCNKNKYKRCPGGRHCRNHALTSKESSQRQIEYITFDFHQLIYF